MRGRKGGLLGEWGIRGEGSQGERGLRRRGVSEG